MVTVEGEVKNLSGSCPTLSFKIDDQSVRTKADTNFIDNPCSKIKKNTSLNVRGVRDSGGTIVASQVEWIDHER